MIQENRTHTRGIYERGTLPKAQNYNEYVKYADAYRQLDNKNNFAYGISLTEKERSLNRIMNEIRRETMKGKLLAQPRRLFPLRGKRSEPAQYYPIQNFSEVKSKIEKDALFKLFREMPKGGNLHLHTSATLSIEGFIELIRKFDCDEEWAVYVCKDFEKDGVKLLDGTLLLMPSAYTIPARYLDKLTVLHLYSDEELKAWYSFFGIDKTKSTLEVWNRFHEIFTRISKIISVRQFFIEYYTMSFQELWDDHVDYAELRLDTDELISNNISEIQMSPSRQSVRLVVPDAVQTIWEVYQKFAKEHEGFRLKLIVSESGKKNHSIEDKLNQVYQWMQNTTYSQNNFVLGFELLGERNREYSTQSYARAICESSHGKEIPFYFHDGQNCWADDDNIYTAVALGSKRIGHGLNLFRFPSVVEAMKRHKVALEVCPISNQMLRYTSDLRTHMIRECMNQGIDCVICSDNPMIMGNPGLSYDLWEVYYSQLIDLREIKQFILNSYLYSGMTEEENAEQLQCWEKKWEIFLDDAFEMIGKEYPSFLAV